MSETQNFGAFSDNVSAHPNAQTADPVTGGKRRVTRRVLGLLVVLIIFASGFFAGKQFDGSSDDVAKIQGRVALSERELRNVVVSQNITAYWAGPLDGAKYTLVATNPGLTFVRYLPGGVGVGDTKTAFRSIGTYTLKNAFAVSTAGGQLVGNSGFVSPDGNAVFYSLARPSNVYVGIKGQDIQLEIFDPVADQAASLARLKGLIQEIK